MTSAGRALVTAALVVVTLGASATAATLALARTLEPGTRRGIELVAFTPAGLPAALLGVVAALLLLRRSRATGSLALIGALGLVLLHAWWMGPQYVGEVPAADPAGPRLVVMTQNFEEGKADEVAALVQRHRVDILVVTDAPEAQVDDLVSTGIGAVLPHNTLGQGRGSVVWSRYPISSDTFISDGGDSRVLTLDVPGLSRVTLVAVHPTPPYQENGSRWQADWDRLLPRIVDSYDIADGRMLVVGDLNATADHWPVRSLGEMGFRDVAEQLNSGLATTWPANGTYTRLGLSVPALLALDHVLTSPGLVPTDQVVTSDVGSDHGAVIATIAGAR